MEEPDDVRVLLDGLEVGSVHELAALVRDARAGVVVTPHQVRALVSFFAPAERDPWGAHGPLLRTVEQVASGHSRILIRDDTTKEARNMGVRTLVGTADGTIDAAAMYDSASGWMIGPIWEAPDAADQIEAFQQWLREGRWASASAEIFGAPPAGQYMVPLTSNPGDPRSWTDAGLERIISYWRRTFVGEDGYLLDAFECSCGSGHHHIGDDGETARHGECSSCACTTWKPGNAAAARAAEGE